MCMLLYVRMRLITLLVSNFCINASVGFSIYPTILLDITEEVFAIVCKLVY